ncbi:MAG: DNA translocase FtsK [Chthoniobacterales bacterium]
MPPAAKAVKTSRPRHWNEVLGLTLVVLGVAYFMALVSYTPRDVPTWVWFNTASPPNNPAQNFVGPVGAVIAGFSYLCIGAASYLVAALLLGYGGVKLALGSPLLRRLPWVVVFIVSGACLAQMQPWFLQSWAREFNNDGPGGTIGYHLGTRLLEKLLGGPGSAMLVLGVYLVSLVLATGIRPIHLLIATISWIKSAIIQAFESAEERRLQHASEAERHEAELHRLEKEQRRLEKDLRKKGVPNDLIVGVPLEPAPFRPPPKVTDTSVPLPSAAKPKLEKKEQALLNASADGAFDNYQKPDFELLDERDFTGHSEANHEELLEIQRTLIETLAHFGIAASPGDITKGPTITRYEVYPAKGVRVDRIASLEADIQRATRAERINILAPIPGKDTVGIEIANSKKVKVTLREILESEDWANTKARIPIALGKDVYGKTIIADLAAMPHCLVAGTTGSGKSVCINAVIASILYKFTPDELRFIMIDPKVVEMQIYNTLPHLVVPVVTDPKKVLLALRWVINEMENRYQMFAKLGVRNIASFNARPLPKTQAELDADRAAEDAENEKFPDDSDELTPDDFISDAVLENAAVVAQPELPKMSVARDDDLIIPNRLPYIVVIVDELADLMQTAPADVESGIARITQKARAAGIHMIIATQTPRADVITGVIKANVPCRIAFQVASGLDSRIILDEKGAERLLGQGDMLYMPPSSSRLIRSQGVLVTDDEIQKLVDFVSAQAPPSFDEAVQQKIETGGDEAEEISEEDEELVTKCLEIIRQEKKASTSLLQRRLRLGYTRAARIVDILEDRGILGPGEGAKPREILVDLDSLV